MKYHIPKEVSAITQALREGGFEAYLVGGCVRDLIIGRTPRDWDITTNAKPAQIEVIFPDSFYNNSFGTVGVVTRETEDESLKVIEITPYRTESTYSDHRRPDAVEFADKLEDDLKRRDFTINAIAYDDHKGQAIDLFDGLKDIKDKVVRAVGNADDRFTEDALRMLRAIRIATELDFVCENETGNSIFKNSQLLEKISKERIRDEFTKIVMSAQPAVGLFMLEKFGVLQYIAPVLRETIGVEQNKQAHKYTVWEHLLRSMQHAADKGWGLEIHLAALFHDISKPYTKREIKDREGNIVDCTFYNHEVIGSKVTRETLTALKYPNEVVEKVSKLVRWHMFFSDTEQITLSAVRRLIVNVGQENIHDLIHLRMADRIGTGRPKESPYRLRKFQSMIDEAMRDPISVGMLKIKGTDVIRETGENPGRKIGYILHALLEQVLDDPSKNDPTFLVKQAKELALLDENALKNMAEIGKSKKEEAENEALSQIRKEHSVN